MTRLILTGESGVSLFRSDLADVVIPFIFRFVWGPLPSPDELAAYLAARSDKHAPGTHWSDYGGRWPIATKARKDFGLAVFRVPTLVGPFSSPENPTEVGTLNTAIKGYCP